MRKVATDAILTAVGMLPAAASGRADEAATRLAFVPPGPHPAFAAWEQAGRDAQRDFKLGADDFKTPPGWGLSQQNDLVESLAPHGCNAVLIFPGDPVGERSTAAELSDMNTRILIIDQPTVGIDVGSKACFHSLIHDLARQGNAVLLISSDMPERITLADRILVMNRYRIEREMLNERNDDRMSRAIMAHIHDTQAA